MHSQNSVYRFFKLESSTIPDHHKAFSKFSKHILHCFIFFYSYYFFLQNEIWITNHWACEHAHWHRLCTHLHTFLTKNTHIFIRYMSFVENILIEEFWPHEDKFASPCLHIYWFRYFFYWKLNCSHWTTSLIFQGFGLALTTWVFGVWSIRNIFPSKKTQLSKEAIIKPTRIFV